MTHTTIPNKYEHKFKSNEVKQSQIKSNQIKSNRIHTYERQKTEIKVMIIQS